MKKPIVLKVTAWPDAVLAELAKKTGFNLGTARRIEEDTHRWSEDHLVWLFPNPQRNRYDCIHSLYSLVVKEQSTFSKLIGVHGLYCLAEHLRQNGCPELKPFTGPVYAFGGSRSGKKTVLKHQEHIGFDVLDLLTPVLCIETGKPRSIYTKLHSAPVEEEFFVGFCGSSLMFDFEEEGARLAK